MVLVELAVPFLPTVNSPSFVLCPFMPSCSIQSSVCDQSELLQETAALSFEFIVLKEQSSVLSLMEHTAEFQGIRSPLWWTGGVL